MEFGEQTWVREFFHWQFSGVVISVVFGTGIAFMLAGEFAIAYFLLSVSGIWAICYWLSSDFLKQKREETRSRHIRRDPLLCSRAQRSFRGWKYGGVLVCVALTTLALVKNQHLQFAAELKQYDGWLYSANEPDPLGWCPATGKELSVYMGGQAVVISGFPKNVIAFDGVPQVRVNRRPDGAVALNLSIKDADGKLIVDMGDDGKFTVNQNNILRMDRPDKSHLTIRDQKKEEVLNVFYVNQNTMILSARFYIRGKPYDIANTQIHGICFHPNQGTGSAISIPTAR